MSDLNFAMENDPDYQIVLQVLNDIDGQGTEPLAGCEHDDNPDGYIALCNMCTSAAIVNAIRRGAP